MVRSHYVHVWARSKSKSDCPVQIGAELAEKWCNACHYTGENDPRMFDAGPHFVSLAGNETEYLLNAMVRPHDFMPEFPRLSYSDMLDLAAFIQSRE